MSAPLIPEYSKNPQQHYKEKLENYDASDLDFLQKNNGVTSSEFVKSLSDLFNETQQQKNNKELKIIDNDIDYFIDKCIKNTDKKKTDECLNQLVPYEFLGDITFPYTSTDFLQFVINIFKDCKDINLIKHLAFNLDIKFITSDKCESISEYKNHYYNSMKNIENKINNKEDLKKYKMYNDLFFRIVEILINKINNKIKYSDKENEKETNPLAIYKQQFTRKQLENNPIYYNPFSPVVFFGGYNYEFKKNNNQSVRILRKIFNSLIRELRLHNKILNKEDIDSINQIFDTLEKAEDELTKFIVNSLNNIKNMDSTAQQKCLDDLNKEYTKKQEKIYTISQKLNTILDYIIKEKEIVMN